MFKDDLNTIGSKYQQVPVEKWFSRKDIYANIVTTLENDDPYL